LQTPPNRRIDDDDWLLRPALSRNQKEQAARFKDETIRRKIDTMMEWEPISTEHSSTPWPSEQSTSTSLCFNDVFEDRSMEAAAFTSSEERDSRSERTNSNSLHRGGAVTEAESTIVGTLPPSDVLLIETFSKEPRLSNHVKGNGFYRTLISQHRQNGRITRSAVTFSVVRSIMEAISTQDGRFLQYDSRQGVVTVLSNNDAARAIRRDLIRGIRSRRTSKSFNKNKAPRRKTHRRNAVVKSTLDKNIHRKSKGKTPKNPTSTHRPENSNIKK